MKSVGNVSVFHGNRKWMINLGTFHGRKFTYTIFFLVLVMLGAVVIGCLIPTYPQKDKTSANPPNLQKNPLF